MGLCPKLSCLFQEHQKGDRFQSRGPQYTVKAGTWSATQLIGGLIIDPSPSPSMSSDPRIFLQIARWPSCKASKLESQTLGSRGILLFVRDKSLMDVFSWQRFGAFPEGAFALVGGLLPAFGRSIRARLRTGLLR